MLPRSGVPGRGLPQPGLWWGPGSPEDGVALQRLPGTDRRFGDRPFGPFYWNNGTGGMNLTRRDWAVYGQTLVLLLLSGVAHRGPSRPRK